jgi:hypothetical protein
MTARVSIGEAARYFRVSSGTVRRWIRGGCPCVEPGSVGRGHGASLNIDDVARWRATQLGVVAASDDVMQRIDRAIADVICRDGGSGVPIHTELGIDTERAATFVTHIYNRISRAINGSD